MNAFLSAITNNLVQILGTVITGLVGYIGLRMKKIYQEYITDKTKKSIIEKVVNYVEQTGKNLSCEEKKSLAKEKSLKWLKERKIQVSDIEIEILIESSVKCLKD